MPYFTHNSAELFYTISRPTTPSSLSTSASSLSASTSPIPQPSPENSNKSEKPRTILLLHGWTCDSHDYTFTIPFLTSPPVSLTVIALDHRGHGRSSAPLPPSESNPAGYEPDDVSYSSNELALDAVALLTHLQSSGDVDTGKVLVVGHSMGTLPASEMAVLCPDLVAGVVLIEPIYGITPLLPSDAGMALFTNNPSKSAETAAGFLGAWGYTNLAEGVVGEWIKVWHQRRCLSTPPWVVRKCHWETHCGSQTWARPAEKARKFLEGRRCARLVVFGGERSEGEREFERGLLEEEERKLGKRNGKSRIVDIAQASHWPHVVKHDEFNRALEGWLRENEFIQCKI